MMSTETSPIKLIYTTCFLIHGNDILMLYRNNPPNRGLWNGVGGHIEAGETPRQSCLREVREETGFQLDDVRFGGLLTWRGFEIPAGGLYIYTALAPGVDVIECKEGSLQWFPRSWVFSSNQVVSNIHYFLPHVLSGRPPLDFYFEYHNGNIMGHRTNALPAWLDLSQV